MSIEKIMKETTINLPRSLTLKEAEELLEHIGKKLPGNVNYNVSYFRSIIHKEGEGILKKGKDFEISGIMDSRREDYPSYSFKCESSQDFYKDISTISEISFNIVEEWKIPDYGPEARKLWSDVRRVVEEYF